MATQAFFLTTLSPIWSNQGFDMPWRCPVKFLPFLLLLMISYAAGADELAAPVRLVEDDLLVGDAWVSQRTRGDRDLGTGAAFQRHGSVWLFRRN